MTVITLDVTSSVIIKMFSVISAGTQKKQLDWL